MAKSKDSFFKREKEKKRLQDRKEKEERKIQRKAEAQKGLGIDSMMAYVDEYGNLSSTPPDPRNKIEIKAEDIKISIPPLTVRLSDRHSLPRRIVCPQAHNTLPTSGIPSGRRSSWVCSEFCTSFTAATRQGNSAL